MEEDTPIQIHKVKETEAESEGKYTSYAENETIRMGVKTKQLTNPKKSVHIPNSYFAEPQSYKKRQGSELDHLIGEPTEMMNEDHGEDSYHPDEFGHIRYG